MPKSPEMKDWEAKYKLGVNQTPQELFEKEITLAEMLVRAESNKKAQEQLARMQELLETEGLSEELIVANLRLALSHFSGDLGIVGHAGESSISILDKPKSHGEYTLANTFSDSDIENIKGKNKKVVLIIQCMDKDGAAKTYEAVMKKYEGQAVVPVLLSIGGGIAQEDVITRDVAPDSPMRMQVNRQTALRLAVKSLNDIVTQFGGEIAAVHALTHNCRCGACAFYNNGQGVPEQLGVNKGDSEENYHMLDLAVVKAQQILDGIIRSPKIYPGMANFGKDTGDDFNRGFVGIIRPVKELKKINPPIKA